MDISFLSSSLFIRVSPERRQLEEHKNRGRQTGAGPRGEGSYRPPPLGLCACSHTPLHTRPGRRGSARAGSTAQEGGFHCCWHRHCRDAVNVARDRAPFLPAAVGNAPPRRWAGGRRPGKLPRLPPGRGAHLLRWEVREPCSACAWGHRQLAGEHEPCCTTPLCRVPEQHHPRPAAQGQLPGAAWQAPGPSSSCPLLYSHKGCLPNESIQISQCFCPLNSSITPSRTDLKHPRCVWSCYFAARIAGAQEAVNHATLILSLTMRIWVSLHLPVTGGLQIVLNKHPGSCTCNSDWVRRALSRLGPCCLCQAAERRCVGARCTTPNRARQGLGGSHGTGHPLFLEALC